jgi:hypothetical protein
LPEISTGNDISAHWVQCFSFFGYFWQPGEKKKKNGSHRRYKWIFLGKIGPKSPNYEETKSKLLSFRE